jgi:malonate decarboxylase delta subunit
MEIIEFQFNAGQPSKHRCLVGCVGSGDLEVLMEPNASGVLSIKVTTSVDGSEARWKNLFERMFSETLYPAMKLEINDFGATPGVVRLRIEQGLEEVSDV